MPPVQNSPAVESVSKALRAVLSAVEGIRGHLNGTNAELADAMVHAADLFLGAVNQLARGSSEVEVFRTVAFTIGHFEVLAHSTRGEIREDRLLETVSDLKAKVFTLRTNDTDFETALQRHLSEASRIVIENDRIRAKLHPRASTPGATSLMDLCDGTVLPPQPAETRSLEMTLKGQNALVIFTFSHRLDPLLCKVNVPKDKPLWGSLSGNIFKTGAIIDNSQEFFPTDLGFAGYSVIPGDSKVLPLPSLLIPLDVFERIDRAVPDLTRRSNLPRGSFVLVTTTAETDSNTSYLWVQFSPPNITDANVSHVTCVFMLEETGTADRLARYLAESGDHTKTRAGEFLEGLDPSGNLHKFVGDLRERPIFHISV